MDFRRTAIALVAVSVMAGGSAPSAAAVRQPDFVQIDYAWVEDRVVAPANQDREPVQAWFHVLWHKNDKRDNLVHLGHHSPVFGFTTDLEPREENVLIEDPIAAQRQVDGEALYRLAENDPSLYSNPRLVRFGLRTSF